MFIKMKESKGFTLVELMIVVAIIGILAAVAVPFYQKYIQKSRLTSKVFPGMHAIETNVGTFYSFQQKLTMDTATFNQYTADADTTCFTPTWANDAGLTITINIAKPVACPSLTDLNGLVLVAKPSLVGKKIGGWVLSGTLATQLGLAGEK